MKMAPLLLSPKSLNIIKPLTSLIMAFLFTQLIYKAMDIINVYEGFNENKRSDGEAKGTQRAIYHIGRTDNAVICRGYFAPKTTKNC